MRTGMRGTVIALAGLLVVASGCSRDGAAESKASPATSGAADPTVDEARRTAEPEVDYVEVVGEGAEIDPPVEPERIPPGSWYCDMGTVHYAATKRHDGMCPVCNMNLKERVGPGHEETEEELVRIDLAPTDRTPDMRWRLLNRNVADLPSRSDPSHQPPFLEPSYTPGLAKEIADKPAAEQRRIFIENLLNRWDVGEGATSPIRHEPWGLLYAMRHMDYYANREAIQAQFEQFIDAAPDDKVPAYLSNYAWILLYAGEFEKLEEYFPPVLERRPDGREHGSVTFAVAQAFYRTGDYEEAVELAKVAQDEVKDAPNDTRWLLMLAEMALYGADYFDKYSIDRFRLKHVKKWFPKADWELPYKDVTATLGDDVEWWGGYGSVIFADFDEDGWDDLFYERKYFDPMIYKNVEGEDLVRVAGTDFGIGPTAPASPGDIDNDGLLDVFRPCCNYDGTGPLGLMHNKGDLKFEQVVEQAGLGDERTCAMSPAWVDWDLDGYLDLLMANWCGPTRAYHNNGDGTFTEVAEAIGLETPGDPWPSAAEEDAGEVDGPGRGHEFGSHGIAVGYYYGGRYPDVYIQGWGWRNFYKNNGDGTFTLMEDRGGLPMGEKAKNYWAFSFDYNNDGRDDVMSGSYVVGSGERYGITSKCTCSNLLTKHGFSERETDAAPTIFENQGDGTFEDIRHRAKFIPLGAMGYNYGDWDNDGDEDLVFGLGGPFFQQTEPFLFYRNDGGGEFTNMTPFTMQSLWGKGHGIGFADFNHDGQLDLALNNGGAMPGDAWPGVLLENTGTDNHWLRIKLEPGEGTNALAMGARVVLRAGDLLRNKTRWSGGSFGESSFTMHFGLGKNPSVDRIEVRWPNKAKTTTVIEGPIETDRTIAISQDTGKWRTLHRPEPEAKE